MIRLLKGFVAGIIMVATLPFVSFAQSDTVTIVNDELTIEMRSTPKDWHLLDKEESGHYGISLEKAYNFLKGKNSKPVLVAVIDSGIDTLHEDLKPVLWRNPGEIPGNGIDDDKNGYIDDVYGWNFLGGKDGRNVNTDSYEGARVYWSLKPKYDKANLDTTKFSAVEKAEYVTFLRAKDNVVGNVNPAEVLMMERILPVMERGDSIIAKDLGKEEFDGNDLKTYAATSPDAKTAAALYLNICRLNDSYDITNQQILGDFRGQLRKHEAARTPPVNYRNDIVQDNYNDVNDRFYGNNDVMAGTPSHGTHCAGIIAAARNNNKGMDGVADNVRIMMLRAVPDGDEHDKDIANSIRYAVDNGAQIISMSFGKSFSPQKHWVDEAVQYAADRGVLLIHAAGNDAKDLDNSFNYPSAEFRNNSGRATNYITVGASGDVTNGGFTARFSNYGKNEVDVFAPGVAIYSTLPGGNNYGSMSGTSMAAPVVAGLAALILEYFPSLSAEQIKYAIEHSVTPITEKVKLPGTDDLVNMSDISKTGGEVNAYNAVKLAATLKGERNVKKDFLPASKIKNNKRG